MEGDEAWDLEMELLGLVGTGSGTVARMRTLCGRIAAACADTLQHVIEPSHPPTDSHRERPLRRWVQRQPWCTLLPELYVFAAPLTYYGGQTTQDGQHASLVPLELFSAHAARGAAYRRLEQHVAACEAKRPLPPQSSS